MSPFEYLDRYHKLQVVDQKLGLAANVNITKYISGWTHDNMGEYMAVLSSIAVFHKLKGPSLVPDRFAIDDSRMHSWETFYKASVRRTFEGRGSPDDITDTLRLAVWGGRCSTGGASAYAAKWFGQDCNAFVGNYQGVSPSSAIFAYALGYGGSGTIPGATPDVYASRNLLPLNPDKDFKEIAEGDVLCTYGSADKNGNRWRHIALVNDITLLGQPAGDAQDAILSIAEWGAAGDLPAHKVENAKVTLKRGKLCDALPGKTVTAFSGHDPEGKAALRIFFDASSLWDYDSRGWQVGSIEGV